MQRRKFAVALGALVIAGHADAADSAACAGSAGGLTEKDYRAYLDAFNRHDFEAFGRYYSTDVVFEGRGGTFQGRDQVLSFYRGAQSRLRERIVIQDLILGPQGILADLVTSLYVLQDWPDFAAGALRKGQTVQSENFIWYEVAARRFTRIRSAHYRYL